MSGTEQEQPLLKKSYLVMLGLALLVMLLLNPGVLRTVLPQRESTPPPSGPEHTDASDSETADPGQQKATAEIAAIKRDVSAFNHWFMNTSNTPAANIVIMRSAYFTIERLDENPTKSRTLHYAVVHHCPNGGRLSPAALRERLAVQHDPAVKVNIGSIVPDETGTNFTVQVHVDGVGRVGLEVDTLPPMYYDVNILRLWSVDIRGTVHDQDAGWMALFGQETLSAGDRIAADAVRCGYQVLHVTRRCVWLLAMGSERKQAKLPLLRWPDLERIVLSPDRKPLQVELRPGVTVGPGDSIDFRSTRARITVDRLWPNAAHFRYQPAGSRAVYDLVCILVQ